MDLRTGRGAFALALLLTVCFLPEGGCAERNRIGITAQRAQSTIAALTAQFDVGETVWKVVRQRLEQSAQNPAALLQVWDDAHAQIVAAINTTAPPQLTRGLISSVKDLLPFIDDDTLPALARDLADILDLLAHDPSDPRREVLKALTDVLNGHLTRRLYLPGSVSDVFSRALAYPQVAEADHALIEMLRQNDGEDDLGRPNGETDLLRRLQTFLSEQLRGVSLAGGLPPSSYLDSLLEEAQLTGTIALGPPAWCVRVDGIHARGLPLVRRDPVSGALPPPFVDRDADGLADVDAQGEFVDPSGARIDLAPFGLTGRRDFDGRAVAADGRPLYVYFDMKRTHLGLLLRFGGRLIGAGADDALLESLPILMGPRVRHDNGTSADPSDDYDGYRDDTALGDLLWGGAELARQGSLRGLLEAVYLLARQRPSDFERLLVALTQSFQASHTTSPMPLMPLSTSGSSSDAWKFIDDLLPLFDRMLEAGQAQQVSTLRELMDALRDLGPTARELPGELAVMMRYRKLRKIDPLASGVANIDRASSLGVDRSQPAYYIDAQGRRVDNRSLQQQLLEIVIILDGCKIFGQSLAELIIDRMAGLSPATAGALAQLVSGTGPLAGLICSGLGNQVAAVGDLASSGALDAYLPLARVFKNRGQTRLLIELLKTMGASYDTVVRPGEGRIVDLLERGAFEPLLDSIAASTRMAVPGGQGVLADHLARALEDLVDDDRPVVGRNGALLPTPLHQVLRPLKALDALIDAQIASGSSARASIDKLADIFLKLAFELRRNDAGTPLDPRDDYDELANRSILPMAARTLEELRSALPADQAARDAKVADLQQWTARALTGKELPVFLDLALALKLAPGRPALVAAVANLLTPGTDRQSDVFGAELEILGAVLSARVQPNLQALEPLLRFGGRVLDPSRPHVRNLARAIVRLESRGGQNSLLTITGNLIRRSGPGQPTPLDVFIEVARQLETARSGRPPGLAAAFTQAELGDLLDSTTSFIRDPHTGLERIFTLIKQR